MMVCDAQHDGIYPDYVHQIVTVPVSEITIGRLDDLWPGYGRFPSNMIHALWTDSEGLLHALHELDDFREEEAP